MRTIHPLILIALISSQARANPEANALALDRALGDVLRAGGDVYNAGDFAGSFRVFEGGALALGPLLADRPDAAKALAAALAAGRAEPRLEEKAFHLQRAMTRLRADINPPKPATAPAAFKLSDDEQAVLDLVNVERKTANLPPLKANEPLTKAAREHVANMAKQGKLEHTLDDKGPGERLAAVGYQSTSWGENIAMGAPTPVAAMTIWMNSEGHRNNILGRFAEIGIGMATDAAGQRYWTQVFAVPAGR